jgi:uncharacterized protein DUF6949
LGKRAENSVSEILAFGFAVATGFVAAGLGASAFQLATNQRLSFEIPDWTLLSKFLLAIVIVLAGPVILMRNGLRGWILEKRHPGWLAGTIAIATGWSFISGLFMLHMALALQA